MNRLDLLRARRIDNDVKQARLLGEVYKSLTQSESVRYAIGAMQPIDPEYTRVTFEQGERVKSQLQQHLSVKCDYEYQGSVTNDTHIRARSDIDLLLLTSEFHYLQPPQAPSNPYTGDTMVHLASVRTESKSVLETAFPQAEVDGSGGKSVAVEGGSLRRKVDVVTAAWYDTNDYARTGEKTYRGVKIFDKDNNVVRENYPFLNNFRIDQKDRAVGGALRKASRLMKSLKYDSETVDLSSYDIVAIACAMPNDFLAADLGQDLAIVERCRVWCHHLLARPDQRDLLDVPDGSRKIFAPGAAAEAGLGSLTQELDGLSTDILRENSRSFRQLEEARVAY